MPCNASHENKAIFTFVLQVAQRPCCVGFAPDTVVGLGVPAFLGLGEKTHWPNSHERFASILRNRLLLSSTCRDVLLVDARFWVATASGVWRSVPRSFRW